MAIIGQPMADHIHNPLIPFLFVLLPCYFFLSTKIKLPFLPDWILTPNIVILDFVQNV